MFFIENCDQSSKQDVHEALQIPTEALKEIYLGLPTAVGTASDGTFDYASDRIRNFIHGWVGQFLRNAGQEVLIKTNAQAVLTYPMSCFKLPAPTCIKMKQYITNYWRGSLIDNHKIHCQRWSKLSRAKGEGGMGFHDQPLFNQAMLGKQVWRLLSRPESLCAKVLKGKYFPTQKILEATRKTKSSKTWRAILFAREALVKGMIKRVGSGDSINVWTNNWIAGTSSVKPLVRQPEANVEKVNELFVPKTRHWDEQRVHDSFYALDAL